MNGIIWKKERIMDQMIDYENYTKISINKDLHKLVKKICAERGTKMYFFEDAAIKKYIKENFSEYIENGYAHLFEEEK